jgi:hypothetical protein
LRSERTFEVAAMLRRLTLEELETNLRHVYALLEDLAGSLQVGSDQPMQTGRNVHLAIRALRLEIAGTAHDAVMPPLPVLPVGNGMCGRRMQSDAIQHIFVELATRELDEDFDQEAIRHLDRLVALGTALLWLLCEDSTMPGELLRPVWRRLIEDGKDHGVAWSQALQRHTAAYTSSDDRLS